jgi:hypothetical protein
MYESLIAILPGIAIYIFVSIASQFVLTQLWKASQVLARFFRDTADGRTLSRQAGYRLNIDERDEPRLYLRLDRSVTLITWFRYLAVGTALVFVAAVGTILVRPTPVVEHFRLLVFVASAVHVLSPGISYVLFRRNQKIVMTASDRREY